jgi:hypothetical protein
VEVGPGPAVREGPGPLTEPAFVSGPHFAGRCGRDGVVRRHRGISPLTMMDRVPMTMSAVTVHRRVRDTMGTSRHSQGRGSGSSSRAPGA